MEKQKLFSVKQISMNQQGSSNDPNALYIYALPKIQSRFNVYVTVEQC